MKVKEWAHGGRRMRREGWEACEGREGVLEKRRGAGREGIVVPERAWRASDRVAQ